MKRTIKGAVAAGGAALLLTGGMGTLAFWSDEETVTGRSITSGELALGAPQCGSWTLDGGAVYAAQLLVPGDSVTRTCTLDLVATGDHVAATLALEAAGFTAANGLTADLTPTAVFTVNDATKTTITSDDDTGATNEIEVVVTVDFDGAGAVNASQDLTAVLDDLTFTATQTHDPVDPV